MHTSALTVARARAREKAPCRARVGPAWGPRIKNALASGPRDGLSDRRDISSAEADSSFRGAAEADDYRRLSARSSRASATLKPRHSP